ncbi:MAG: nucleotidyltransferase domain-containing protein [Negativicutes bacterium]
MSKSLPDFPAAVFVCLHIAVMIECSHTEGGYATMLTANESLAIAELKTRIVEKYDMDSMILFGSKARSDDSRESDIDVLSLVNQNATNEVEEGIFDLAYDVGLRFDVVFGIIVKNIVEWRKMDFHPLKQNIDREGITL